MKKILHIYKTYYPFSRGGVETTIDFLQKKKSKKYKIFFAGCGKKELKKKNVHIFKTNFEFFSNPFSLKFILYVLKNQNKFHLIHFHSPWPTAEILSIFLNNKIICNYHSDIIRQKKIFFFYKIFQKFFLKKCKFIIVHSKSYFKSSKIISNLKNVKIISGSVNDSKLNSKVSYKKSFKNYICFVGSNRGYKGLNLLQKLINNTHFNFVLVGKNLRFLSSNNCKVYENISEREKLNLIKDSFFLILTSNQRNEAYGLVLIEALMMRKPILTSDLLTGFKDINKNNVGFKFKNNDFASLENSVKRFYSISYHEYKLMCENSREKYLLYHKPKLTIKKYYKIYDIILNKKN